MRLGRLRSLAVMYIADKFIFLELPKTGCTHIVKIMSELVDGIVIGKHHRLHEVAAKEGRYIIGSVRNPWDWYVSLWAYSCSGVGALYGYTARNRLRLKLRDIVNRPKLCIYRLIDYLQRDLQDWHAVYDSSADPENFRQWLRMMYDPKYKYSLGNSYGLTALSNFAGYYTFQYASLFVEDRKSLFSSETVHADNLTRFLKDNSVLDFVIRNESLESDLVEVLDKCGVIIDAEKLQKIHDLPRTNTSVRDRVYAGYYDEETLELVKKREFAIIDMYGYEP